MTDIGCQWLLSYLQCTYPCTHFICNMKSGLLIRIRKRKNVTSFYQLSYFWNVNYIEFDGLLNMMGANKSFMISFTLFEKRIDNKLLLLLIMTCFPRERKKLLRGREGTVCIMHYAPFWHVFYIHYKQDTWLVVRA